MASGCKLSSGVRDIASTYKSMSPNKSVVEGTDKGSLSIDVSDDEVSDDEVLPTSHWSAATEAMAVSDKLWGLPSSSSSAAVKSMVEEIVISSQESGTRGGAQVCYFTGAL